MKRMQRQEKERKIMVDELAEPMECVTERLVYSSPHSKK
jgi:hypothetical protein